MSFSYIDFRISSKSLIYIDKNLAQVTRNDLRKTSKRVVYKPFKTFTVKFNHCFNLQTLYIIYNIKSATTEIAQRVVTPGESISCPTRNFRAYKVYKVVPLNCDFAIFFSFLLYIYMWFFLEFGVAHASNCSRFV